MRWLTRASTSTSFAFNPCCGRSRLATKTAIGVPHARWREITQSGFASIMPVMRFCPDGGTHCVSRIAPSATSRKVGMLEDARVPS